MCFVCLFLSQITGILDQRLGIYFNYFTVVTRDSDKYTLYMLYIPRLYAQFNPIVFVTSYVQLKSINSYKLNHYGSLCQKHTWEI